MSLETVTCDLCGGGEHSVVASVPDRLAASHQLYDVVVCARCGLAFTNPRPPATSLAEHYPPGYFPFERLTGVSSRVESARRIRSVEQLRRLRQTPGRALEVGCGTGRFLRTLDDAGWSVSGVEPDSRAASEARAHGLDVFTGVLDDAPLSPPFDLIVLRHVLEHVPSPTSVLQRCRELLAPGGHLLLAVPNFGSVERRVLGRWWGDYDVPRHLYHFTRPTLTSLLNKSGLAVRSVRYSIAPNAWVWALHHWLASRGAGRLAAVSTPNSALVSAACLPLSLGTAAIGRGGRMQVVAQRA